jgi:hypothetical protein
LQRRTIHHDGVELSVAFAIQMRSDTSVKNGIVFQIEDRQLAGVYRRSPAFEDRPAFGQGPLDTRTGGGFDFLPDGSGTSMNNESEITHRGSISMGRSPPGCHFFCMLYS